MNESARIAAVRVEFVCEDDRSRDWRVRFVRVEEALSSVLRAEVALEVDDDDDIDPEALLGAPARLSFVRGEQRRSIRGIVDDISWGSPLHGSTRVRLRLTPALQSLAHRVSSRAWQDSSVVEIVEEVLSGVSPGVLTSVCADAVVGHRTRKRDYCVQLRESSLEFIERLLAEEGLTYHFPPDGEDRGGAIALTGSNSDFREIDEGGRGPVIRLITHNPEAADEASIQRLDARRRIGSTSFVRRDFDWRRPGRALERTVDGVDERGEAREHYEHGERRYIVDDGAERLRDAAAREALAASVLEGVGNATSFYSGGVFECAGHPRAGVDGRYLIVSVIHEASAEHEASGPYLRYHNSFTCVPIAAAFRPPLRERPLVHGPQTAIVEGPGGEEIHTDAHGRIKVRFHWDRTGGSSCWVRVAQAWAGAGFGVQIIPRIGMEVVVDFLEGNPDRPLVIGCVYNGANAPPDALPDDRARTCLRTESSPGGAGYHELRIDDAAGSEEIFVHGQRDWVLELGNDRSERIGRDDHRAIGRDERRVTHGQRSRAVGGAEVIAVGGPRQLQVAGDQLHTFGQRWSIDVAKDRRLRIHGEDSVEIGGDRFEDVAGGQRHSVGGDLAVTVGQKRVDRVEGSSIVGIAGDRSLDVGGSYGVCVRKGMKLHVLRTLSETIGVARAVTVVGVSSEKVGLKKSITAGDVALEAIDSMMIKAGGEVSLTTDRKLSVAVVDDIAVQGKKKAMIEVADELTLVVGSASIKLRDGEVRIDANKIVINGAEVAIKGTKGTKID
ncbi:MAG: type VI secretion system tip protein VgrG [Myxococcales bacterium]|nr:type VI secretion system tip protein VgrG [Myxococcales bacterium]